MYFYFQTDPGHADRILNSGLLINDELLGKYMNNLTIHGNCDGTCRIDHPLHIGLGNLRPLDCYDAVAVETGDMAPGYPGVHRRNFTSRHEFRFFNRLLNRTHGRFNVDHHTFSKADRGVCADADDVDIVSAELTHYGTNFGRPHIQTDNNILLSLHSKPPYGSRRETQPLRDLQRFDSHYLNLRNRNPENDLLFASGRVYF